MRLRESIVSPDEEQRTRTGHFVGKNLIDFFLIMFVKNEMKTAAIVEGKKHVMV